MKNFYDLLTWPDAAKNSFPERLFFDLRDESFGDLKIYICFKQRQTHLSQGGFKSAPFLWNGGLETAAPWEGDYFFGGGVGDFMGPPAPSSIPKVQCASTFLPCDFAVTNTLQDFSRSFCVTWYDIVPVF